MPTRFQDYYQTLGLKRDASAEQIKRAYRKLARENHPDTAGNDPTKLARFKEVNEANEVLSDTAKRVKYDELGEHWKEYEQWERAGRTGPEPTGFAARNTGQARSRQVDAQDFEQFFGTGGGGFSPFFETFFGGGGAMPFTPPRRRGGNVEGEITISLAEAYASTRRTLEINIGAARTVSRRVEVAVPSGIADGARIRVAGQGVAGQAGGEAGDLMLLVHIAQDPRFSRTADDLSTRVSVPLATALLGGTVEVPTLRGRPVALTVPENTQNGARLRMRGLGMPHRGGEGSGDLYAEVDIRLPVPLSEAQRQAAELLRDATH